MNDNFNTILVGMIVLTLLADIILVFSIVCIYRLFDKAIRTIRYKNNTYAKIDDDIPKVLELFVQNVFTDYRAKNLDCDENLIYISQEKEQQILSEMATLCAQRMSPALTDKLTLMWSYESLGSVLADKIYLTVVAYVAMKNQKIRNVDNGKKELNAVNA